MKIDLLTSMGLGNIDYSYIFIILFVLLLTCIILLIVQIVENRKLKKKFKKFMSGKNAKSLESQVISIISDNKEMKEQIAEHYHDIKHLYKKHEKAFQKLGVVKYDAFNQMGGQLSYSIALLDENNNGFIINSVHSADGSYSYSKEIIKGMCDITLSKEEQEALDQAMN